MLCIQLESPRMSRQDQFLDRKYTFFTAKIRILWFWQFFNSSIISLSRDYEQFYIMEYELMWLVSDKNKENLEQLKSEVNDIVAKAGGTKTGTEIEFEKKLAYEIKHNWRGIYVTSRFTVGNKDDRDEVGAPDTVAEVSRQLNLHKEILRYIVVSAEDLPSLDEFQQTSQKSETEGKKVLKEKGEKIDGKLEKVLKI